MSGSPASTDEAVGLRGFRPRNPKRSEARRQEVLIAAAHVFARDGYDAATLDGVAEALGATKAVIYYYFRSKEDLYNQLRAAATHSAVRRLQEIMDRRDPPEVQLRAAITDLVKLTFNDIDRASIVLGSPASLSQRSKAESKARSRRYAVLLRSILEDGIRAGVFCDHDPSLTAFILSRTCLSVAQWYKPGGPLSAEEVADQVIHQALYGTLKRP